MPLILWVVAALVVGVGGTVVAIRYYNAHKDHASDQIACPTDAQLTQMVADIDSGKTALAVAAEWVKAYAHCPATAGAVSQIIKTVTDRQQNKGGGAGGGGGGGTGGPVSTMIDTMISPCAIALGKIPIDGFAYTDPATPALAPALPNRAWAKGLYQTGTDAIRAASADTLQVELNAAIAAGALKAGEGIAQIYQDAITCIRPTVVVKGVGAIVPPHRASAPPWLGGRRRY